MRLNYYLITLLVVLILTTNIAYASKSKRGLETALILFPIIEDICSPLGDENKQIKCTTYMLNCVLDKDGKILYNKIGECAAEATK